MRTHSRRIPRLTLALTIAAVCTVACDESGVGPSRNNDSRFCPTAVGEWGNRDCTPVVVNLVLNGFQQSPTSVIHLSVAPADSAHFGRSFYEAVAGPGHYLFSGTSAGPASSLEGQEELVLRVKAVWFDALGNESRVAADSADYLVTRVLPGERLMPDTVRIVLSRP